MKIKRVLNLALIVALFAGLLSGFAGAKSNVEQLLKRFDFNGSVLIAQEGKILVSKGYGMADFEKKITNTPATIFHLASVTKQFTALSILMLEEKGLLSTNDPVTKYIPDYPSGGQITIHHLLTHTSGITNYTDYEIPNPRDYYSPEKIIALFKDFRVQFSPGTLFQYSNSNYVILGYIIEKVSGMKYQDFVKQNIFIPLDMKNSGYDDGIMLPNEAIGYSSIKPSLSKADDVNMSIAYAAGALYSTAEDLYKWDQALYTEKLVKKATLKKMFTPYVKVGDAGKYGYGWFFGIFEKPNDEVMFHGGCLEGFSTLIYRDTGKHLVVILLSNEGMKNDEIDSVVDNIKQDY